MTTHHAAVEAPLEAVRARREALVTVMRDVERTLAAPLAGRGAAWAGDLAKVLSTLDSVLDAHIRGTEGAGGLLPTVREQSPYLDPMIRRLEAEHVKMRDRLDRLCAELTGAGPDELELEGVRDHATELLVQIARHRQGGADLLYAAYDVDYGGAE